jgi:domain of unknown function (DUF1083)
MKKSAKLFSLALSLLLAFGAAACGKPDDSSGGGQSESSQESQSGTQDSSDSSSDENSSAGGGNGEIVYTPRKKQEMPTAEVVDKEYDYGDSSAWAGDAYVSKDLGHVYLQDVIDDNVYDWGHSVIKEDGKYKMWWVRPAVYDAVFYAESVDLKNWTNVQRVISLSPNSLNVEKFDNIKGMLGKPSVIHVGDTYYMYFEAPATEDPDITQTVLEWDNQVMLATSKDGIDWEFYSDDKGQPQPVVAMPEELMGNFNDKDYGAGQPSVFYKDGLFYLTYCYVIYSQNIAEIRVATSEDGIHFGLTGTHKKLSPGNGMGVTYNTLTGKYMAAGTGEIWESDTLDFTGHQTYKYYDYDTTTIQTGFYEFVKNAHGLIDTETFYTIHLQGKKSTTSDWRAGYTTWDGYIHAVEPREFAGRMITLPNGGAATEENLKGYRDRQNSYSKVTADAVYAAEGEISIDGEKDAAYDKATRIEVVRPVYGYGSNLTDSWAEVYLAWNENNLYVYARVYDDAIDNSYKITSPAMGYMRDSFDLFIDAPNDHGEGVGQAYGIEQYMVCTGSNNTDFMIKGSDEYDLTSEFPAARHRVRRTEYGYAVELRIEWFEMAEEYIEEGACIGMDFQINDCMGAGVGREAIVVWSYNTGDSFRYVEGMGDVYLVKA